MDHRYIDEHSVAERYLHHTLASNERAEFEAHVVDCQECADRLLLAEMFHNRNGTAKPAAPITPPEPTAAPALPPQPAEPLLPTQREALRVRFVRQFGPWQLLAILAVAAALLVLVTAGLLLWVLYFGRVLG